MEVEVEIEMQNGKKICSFIPHLDIENNFSRTPIEYYVEYPEEGLNSDTGLIFTVFGYNGDPSSEYEFKLRRYLADKYNCIVISVDYFGAGVKRVTTEDITCSESIIQLLEKCFSSKIDRSKPHELLEFLPAMLNVLKQSGVNGLPPECFLIYDRKSEYQSFGLLAALDYLQVMCEILRDNTINKRRIYIQGTSFGGYIALLLGKIAPKSFRLIVDNSGFVEAVEADMCDDYSEPSRFYDFNIRLVQKRLWSSDSSSKFYFNSHHRDIRDLLFKPHICKSNTQYYITHSELDVISPFKKKAQFKAIRSDFDIAVDAVDESKIDGRLYKTTAHGMDISLRGLFDNAYNYHINSNAVPDDVTDFDLQSQYQFECGNGYTYQITFSHDNVSMELLAPDEIVKDIR